jgi:hypothetical protein
VFLLQERSVVHARRRWRRYLGHHQEWRMTTVREEHQVQEQLISVDTLPQPLTSIRRLLEKIYPTYKLRELRRERKGLPTCT